MPTISANISKRKQDAIERYSNACSETMSDLIRKVVINEAIFLNSFQMFLNFKLKLQFWTMR